MRAMLSVAQAKQRIRQALPAPAFEAVSIDEAGGRFVASEVVSGRALPPWDNSAMDGFAVRAAELPGTRPVAGTSAAGDRPDAVLPAGAVLRIMTGAPVPRGADAVVMREEVDDRGEQAVFAGGARAGQHIRRAGEDVAVGAAVVAAGARLGPGEIGILAAIGCARIEVARRPRVAILSTGDELVDVGVEPGPGQIVNSNAYALAAQIREAGGEPLHRGVAPDRREAIVTAVREALEAADALVTCGGVSVGDYDFVKEAMDEVGVALDFWKVAMKPGKPLAFGVTGDGKPVFGLPGNPVSAMVVFELFARPSLLAMQGARHPERPVTPVVLERGYRKEPGRAHYVRAVLRRDGDRLLATPHPKQGSGMLSSMVGIDALVEIAAEAGDLAPGTTAPALLLAAI
jgi:molybdopterin molybdotransferase